jgi:hypothetical protein
MTEPDRGGRNPEPSELIRQMGVKIRSGELMTPEQACVISGKILYYNLLRMEQKRRQFNPPIGSPGESALSFRISTLERRLMDAVVGDYGGAQAEIEGTADAESSERKSEAKTRSFTDMVGGNSVAGMYMAFAKQIPLSGKPLLTILDSGYDAEIIKDIEERKARSES